MLLLAICHEHQGKLATAWRELRASLATARRADRADRVATAEEHLAIVEPQLTRVTVSVPAETALADLEVLLDGIAITSASYGIGMPLDPGEHLLEARAPNRLPWSTTLAVSAGAEDRTVIVPPLAIEPPRTPPPAPSRVVPIAIAGGTAALSFGLAGYWGVRAIVAEQGKPATCVANDAACTTAAQEHEDRRGRMATLSTVAGLIGAAATGAAFAIWWTRPKGEPSAELHVAPSEHAGATASLTVRF
jgi:hypothetical protein